MIKTLLNKTLSGSSNLFNRVDKPRKSLSEKRGTSFAPLSNCLELILGNSSVDEIVKRLTGSERKIRESLELIKGQNTHRQRYARAQIKRLCKLTICNKRRF